jgi:alpha-beta hydrolase superfamily lysophospholipase
VSELLTQSVALSSVRYDVPAPVNARGTAVVLPGRGEDADVYERLGRRLAADGYVVQVLGSNEVSTADAIASAVGQLVSEAVAPVVLIGSDTGSLQALGLLADSGLAAAVLAGVPAGGATVPDVESWDAELDARTACPAHRARLTKDERLTRGAISAPVAQDLLDSLALKPAQPLLVIHGATDVVAPVEAIRAWVTGLPRAALAVVAGGRHDALNDLNHRSVAAQIVLFIERLRLSPTLEPIVVVDERSHW